MISLCKLRISAASGKSLFVGIKWRYGKYADLLTLRMGSFVALSVGYAGCWPEKNLAKMSHPKMAKTFGSPAKKIITFWMKKEKKRANKFYWLAIFSCWLSLLTTFNDFFSVFFWLYKKKGHFFLLASQFFYL